MTVRTMGKKALETVTEAVTSLEKVLYAASVAEAADDGDVDKLYKEAVYQVVGDLSQGVDVKDAVAYVKKGELWRRHQCFKQTQFILEERDEFIVKPFEVAEGVLTCSGRIKKGERKGQICGSKKTYSYNLQTQSCDEGTAVKVTCASCRHSWDAEGVIMLFLFYSSFKNRINPILITTRYYSNVLQHRPLRRPLCMNLVQTTLSCRHSRFPCQG